MATACLPLDHFKDHASLNGLYCPIGKGVLNKPVFDECGHVFCESCFNAAYKKQETCPISHNKISRNTKPAPEFTEKVNKLLVFCKNNDKNCSWSGPLMEMQKHVSQLCEYRLVDCNIQNCDKKVDAKDLEKHKELCDWRVKKCFFCPFEANDVVMEEHHNFNCQNIPIDCEKKCILKYQRRHKDIHDQYNCEKTKHDCYFRNAGCYFVGTWEEMGRHSSEAFLLHATFLEQKLQHFEAYKKVTQRLIEDIKKDPVKFEGLTKYIKEIDDTEDIDFPMFQGSWDKSHSNKELVFEEGNLVRSLPEGRNQLLWIDRKYHERHRIVFALQKYNPTKGVVGLRVGLARKGYLIEDGETVFNEERLAEDYKLFSDSAAGLGPLTIPFKEGQDYMLSYDPDTCQLVLEQLNINVEKPDEVAVEFPTEFWEFQPVLVLSGEVALKLVDFNDWNQH